MNTTTTSTIVEIHPFDEEGFKNFAKYQLKLADGIVLGRLADSVNLRCGFSDLVDEVRQRDVVFSNRSASHFLGSI